MINLTVLVHIRVTLPINGHVLADALQEILLQSAGQFVREELDYYRFKKQDAVGIPFRHLANKQLRHNLHDILRVAPPKRSLFRRRD